MREHSWPDVARRHLDRRKPPFAREQPAKKAQLDGACARWRGEERVRRRRPRRRHVDDERRALARAAATAARGEHGARERERRERVSAGAVGRVHVGADDEERAPALGGQRLDVVQLGGSPARAAQPLGAAGAGCAGSSSAAHGARRAQRS